MAMTTILSSVVNATQQQLFTNNESQYCHHSPSNTAFPIKREGNSDEQQISGDPKDYQARPFIDIPSGAPIHSS